MIVTIAIWVYYYPPPSTSFYEASWWGASQPRYGFYVVLRPTARYYRRYLYTRAGQWDFYPSMFRASSSCFASTTAAADLSMPWARFK